MVDLHEAAQAIRERLFPPRVDVNLCDYRPHARPSEVRYLVDSDPRSRRLTPALKIEARRLALEYWQTSRNPSLAAATAVQVCLDRIPA